jgi:CubicO group peptidase (beta-lactamase class C family)
MNKPRTLLPWLAGFFCLLLASSAPPVAGQPASDEKNTPVAKLDGNRPIDELFRAWDRPDSPGAAVAVVDHGKIVYEKGFGCANLEYGIPIKPDTIFHVASVSKQFTAMAVVLLEQDGKLSIEDDVHKYLPELPDYGHPITLRNLLQHTSGIRDQWATLGLAGWDLKDVITQNQILRLLFRQKELNFPPGTKWLYSNGGFTLLAEVVKRVSGQPLPQFCAERIFGPIGMSHTHFHLKLEEIVPNRAYSYASSDHGFVFAPLNYANVGATSLFTTAGDLARWLDNFREPKVGNKAAIARLEEEGVLSSGKKTGYALGLFVGTYRGLRTISHDGGDAGYRATVLWFPDQQLGITIVSNLGNFNPGALARKVSDILLARAFTKPKVPEPVAPHHEAIKIDPVLFDKFVGRYESDESPGFILTYTREGDRFYTQAVGQPRFEMLPESETKFFLKDLDAQVTFLIDPDGKVTRLIHHQGGRDHPAHRLASLPEGGQELAEFVGVYWSEELETQYTFFLKDGRLLGIHAHHGEFPLTHNTSDKFGTPLWFMHDVGFLRDEAGKITGATLGGGRVAGVHFVRKPASLDKP